MEYLVPVVHWQAYNSYHDHPELVEPIFEPFRSKADNEYLMRDAPARTNVRVRTLYFWRERLRTEPLWCSSRDHFSENRRTFPDDVEAMVPDFIGTNFLGQGRSLTRITVQPLILMLVHDLVSTILEIC
jgi:hypothetical protein